MSSSIFQVIFIVATIFISWNKVAAGIDEDTYEELPYKTPFLKNFYRTPCNNNEQFSDCQLLRGGTCWSPTFGTNSMCIKGCNCKPGYLRNSGGDCVLPNQCDTTSPPLDHVEPANESPQASYSVIPL